PLVCLARSGSSSLPHNSHERERVSRPCSSTVRGIIGTAPASYVVDRPGSGESPQGHVVDIQVPAERKVIGYTSGLGYPPDFTGTARTLSPGQEPYWPDEEGSNRSAEIPRG